MTKKQLITELHRIQGLLSDALLDEANKNGTDSELWKAVHSVWKEMNDQKYK